MGKKDAQSRTFSASANSKGPGEARGTLKRYSRLNNKVETMNFQKKMEGRGGKWGNRGWIGTDMSHNKIR